MALEAEKVQTHLDQLQGDVSELEARLSVVEAEKRILTDQLVDELAKRIEPNLFEALRTMVDQRLAHESQTRGNVFDAKAPNFRSRKESLTASNGKFNLSSARPIKVLQRS